MTGQPPLSIDCRQQLYGMSTHPPRFPKIIWARCFFPGPLLHSKGCCCSSPPPLLKFQKLHHQRPHRIAFSHFKNKKKKAGEQGGKKSKPPMETCASISFLIICFLLLMKHSLSKTIVVDGLANWSNPTVHVGDSVKICREAPPIIARTTLAKAFKYKQNFFSLYIFRNRKAFDLCDLSQATLLNNGSSQTYTWHPSRMGFFFFSFNNGSVGASCEQGEKASVSVLEKETVEGNSSLPPSSAPSPTPGGGFPSTPAYPLPFHSAAAIAPKASPPVSNPSILPDAGGGIPFINSNPAVPLPTGETDSATIRPLPTSGGRDHAVFWWVLQIQTALALAWFV